MNDQTAGFYRAIMKNRVGRVRGFLQDGQDVNAMIGPGPIPMHTPLVLALLHKRTQIAELLIEEYQAEIGSALFVAIQLKWLQMVKYLFMRGASLTAENRQGQQPLAVAVMTRKIEIMEFLILMGADIFHTDTAGNTVVHHAIANDDDLCVDNVMLFIKKAGDIEKANIANNDGRTPFHVAVSKANNEVVNFFIQNGADACKQDSDGFTPMSLSLFVVYYDRKPASMAITQALIKQGVSSNIPCNTGMSPIGMVVGSRKVNENEVEELLDLLVMYGADPSAVYKNKKFPLRENVAPLFKALKTFTPKILKALVAHKADINARDKWGGTVLHTHLRNLLLMHKSIESREDTATTAALCDLKFDIEAVDAEGNTALHYTTLLGLVAQAKYLLGRGAYMYKKNERGLTPTECMVLLSRKRSRDMHVVFNEAAADRSMRDLMCLRGIKPGEKNNISGCDVEIMRMILEYIHDMPPDVIKRTREESEKQREDVEELLTKCAPDPITAIP